VALLEHSVREDLNKKATRVMAVLNPLKLVITNIPEGKTEEVDALINPEQPELGNEKFLFT
jgi:glutaminyl-tRNA synthetase